MIEIRNVSKVYEVRERAGLFRSRVRPVHALSDVSLSVRQGEAFGLLGPNGAGKTTLMKCIMTLLLPTSGTITVKGFDVGTQPAEVCAILGCMLLGERGLYWKLTGRENLEYFATLHFINRSRRRVIIDEVVERLGLQAFVDRTVETYSAGQRTKLAFARCLVNAAPVLVLDEPTNALDVHAARELRSMVSELHKEGRTILYSTHLLSEAESLCDRVAIIHGGRLVAEDTPSRIAVRSGRAGSVRFSGRMTEEALGRVQLHPLVSRAELVREGAEQQLVVSTTDTQRCLGDLISVLSETRCEVFDVHVERPTLEDAFVALTGGTAPVHPAAEQGRG